MDLPRARHSAWWAVPFALLIAACSMSVGTAERAEPSVAPEVDEPYGSGTWGPSPEPNQLLTKEDLAKQFVFREQRRWSSHIPSGFLLVLPLAAEVVAGRDVTGGPGSRSVHPPSEAQ